MAIVKNLLDARIDIEAQRLWITMALDLLGLYVAKVDVCDSCTAQHVLC